MNHNDNEPPAVEEARAEPPAVEGGERPPDADGAEGGERPPDADGVEGDERPPDADDGKRLEFEDAVELDTTKADLWETISDPEVLTTCVPGAESIERVTDRKYSVEITRGVSHLTVSLSGEAEFVEMDPPDHIVTSARAFDSKTGSDFDILAAMEMTETDDGVRLGYVAEVTYSGGVASINRRLLRPIVERDVDTYFENIRAEVENGA